jgi:hypothetical protein
MLAVRTSLVLLAIVVLFGGANGNPTWADIRARVLLDMPRVVALRGWHQSDWEEAATDLAVLMYFEDLFYFQEPMFGFQGSGRTYLGNAMVVM